MQRYAVGIDLGGTQVRAALCDAEGRVHARAAQATKADAGPDAIVAQIAELAEAVSAAVSRDEIIGAGVSAPGPLDTDAGVAVDIPTLKGFADFPLACRIAEATGLPVTLENDAIAAAYGEWRLGAGMGARHLVYVTVSTGLGGGVVCDGRLLHGRRGLAGHVGHMTIVPGGAPCKCGNRGCFEAYASGTAFGQRAGMDAATVFAQAAAGDARAAALVAEEADYLGIGFASIAYLYSPEVIVVGGGVAQGFAAMEAEFLKRFRANTMPVFHDIRILPAALGGNSGLIGAASLAFEKEPR